jgi:hypothetical protein
VQPTSPSVRHRPIHVPAGISLAHTASTMILRRNSSAAAALVMMPSSPRLPTLRTMFQSNGVPSSVLHRMRASTTFVMRTLRARSLQAKKQFAFATTTSLEMASTIVLLLPKKSRQGFQRFNNKNRELVKLKPTVARFQTLFALRVSVSARPVTFNSTGKATAGTRMNAAVITETTVTRMPSVKTRKGATPVPARMATMT